MKVFIAVFINKLITLVCKLFRKNGTQYPGSFVLDYIDKDILSKIKYPEKTIVVSGSAGKGSTCALIKHILEDSGYSVALNDNGSNGIVGATTMILNNCTLSGNFKKDILLLECDERHLKLVFTKKKPDVLLIPNITRDQPTRNGTPEEVFDDIMKVVDDNVHLVINADDPLVNRVKLFHKGKLTTFGIDNMKDDIREPLLNNVDFLYCPVCHKKLKYKFFHYGHLGSYQCPNKDFERGKVNYLATDIDLEKQNIKINGNNIYINKDVIFAAYATVAAYALANTIGISEDVIVKSLNSDKVPSGLGKECIYKNHKIVVIDTKNENNLSFYQGCKYVRNQKGKKSVVLGFEHVSKRYKESDLSWLYDINFELLNEPNLDKIFIFGKYRYDIANRLLYAGIKKDKIVFVEDSKEIIDVAVKESSGTIYTMVWYDIVKNVMAKVEGENNA